MKGLVNLDNIEMSTEFATRVDLSEIQIKVGSIDDTIDRTKYSSMKECLTCQTALGKTGAKKYFCYFCYQAICAGCSPVEVLHPETRKAQKMCHPCYVHYIKLQVLEVGAEYVSFRLKKETEEKEKLIQELIKLEDENKELKKTRDQKQKENNERIIAKRAELEIENERFKGASTEHDRVKIEYDSLEKTPKSMPETSRGDSCMKCEIF